MSRLAPLVSVSICRWFGLRFDAAGDSQVVGAVAVLETRLVRLEARFDLAGRSVGRRGGFITSVALLDVGEEFRVRGVRADCAACLGEERQRTRLRVEL